MLDEEEPLNVNRTFLDPEVSGKPSLSRVALLRNILSISTNIGSVVGIVMVNKIIFAHYGYPFGIFYVIFSSFNFWKDCS